jgi:excisionase family DNA binding protein
MSNEDLVADGMLNIKEAAAFLHVSRSTLWMYMEKGMLPYAKIGGSRRIPRKALIELASKSIQKGID